MTTTSGAVIREGLHRLGWTTSDLWVAATGIGGSFTRPDVEAIAAGRRPATPVEHDILVSALNDRFVDLGQDHPLAYWPGLRPTPP
jgi:hypothetical protein